MAVKPFKELEEEEEIEEIEEMEEEIEEIEEEREPGRALQGEVRIDDPFFKLSEMLYAFAAERKSREAVAMRLEVQKQMMMMMKVEESKDQESRALAQKKALRSERISSENTGARDGKPIEFEREADPFGLDQFLKDVTKGKELKAMNDQNEVSSGGQD